MRVISLTGFFVNFGTFRKCSSVLLLSLGFDVVDAVHGVHGFFGEDGVAEDADGDLLSLFAAKDEFEEDII